MFRIPTNMRKTVMVLSLCILGISSGGCAQKSPLEGGQAKVENIDASKIDLNKFIDQTFEVSSELKFPGVKNYKSIVGLRETAGQTGYSPTVSFLELGRLTADCLKEGVIIDLNTKSNDADEKINLVFQVLEVRKCNEKESFIKIKVLNKKFFDTKWWISSYDLLRSAKAPKEDAKFKMPF